MSFFVARVTFEGAALRSTRSVPPPPSMCWMDVPKDAAGCAESLRTDARPEHTRGDQRLDIGAGGGDAALMFDTGLNRLGLTSQRGARRRQVSQGIAITAVMSHLACADQPTPPYECEPERTQFRDMAALLSKGAQEPRCL